MEGVGDFRGTGFLTTLGGPALICLCIANYLGKVKIHGKVKINWYWLVPFIQGYIVIYTYIALFGLRLTIPFYRIALFIILGSTLVSVLLCQIVKMNTAYTKPRRVFPMTFGNVLLKIIGVYVLVQALSVILAYGVYSRTIEACLEYIRCRVYAPTSGFPSYSGALIFPLFFSGVGATLVFFLTFAMSPMEDKGDGSHP